jgi:folylpolyglutamate synthase/dihydropteroate synthase
LSAEELCNTANKYTECLTAQSYDEASEMVKDEEVIFVFGSLYLAGALREKLLTAFNS